MKRKGLFEAYTEALKRMALAPAVKLFRHFSMNQFTIDLNKQRQPDESVAAALTRMGTAYRDRILGLLAPAAPGTAPTVAPRPRFGQSPRHPSL
jgi:hypothetical protein